MSAEVIQFIPRPNPARLSLIENEENKAAEFLARAPVLIPRDTSPCEMSQDSGDECA